MKFLDPYKEKRWFKILSNKFVLLILLFMVWMFFFDTNSYFIHHELDKEIKALEKTKEFYKEEIQKDKQFLEKMKDSEALEKYAREHYFLKKDNEDIYIIEDQDSIE